MQEKRPRTDVLHQKWPQAELLHQSFTENTSEPIEAVEGIGYSVNSVIIDPMTEQSMLRHSRHSKKRIASMAAIEYSDKFTQFYP